MLPFERKKGLLVLATGRVFEGYLFGAQPAEGGAGGEVVFNTSLTGYQEILTDPSYEGQIVVMTPSHIGNTGVNLEDTESRKIFLSGFIVQELSGLVSNWRASQDLEKNLAESGVPGLTGVDTRALTRHLREKGAINGLIALDRPDRAALIEAAKKLPGLEGRDLVKNVTAAESYVWSKDSGAWSSWGKRTDAGEPAPKPRRRVVVIDFGVKQNILRCLADLGCEVTVVPATATAAQILALKPDGVLLSNGPGDPSSVRYGIDTIRDLVGSSARGAESGKAPLPMFGICLGHQLLGLALGGETFKLKFGHHGANHPIKEIDTGRVDITSQNHGFAVAGVQKPGGRWVIKGNDDVNVTHINLNDNAVEGLAHATLPVFSVQYHPEAAAGPHDARHLFDRFIRAMDARAN